MAYPGDYILQDGDIISIDGGAYIIDPATKKQWHGDSARTVLVGHTSQARPRLSDITPGSPSGTVSPLCRTQRKSARLGLRSKNSCAAKPGIHTVSSKTYVGHGIGTQMHMAPDVLNYAARDLRPKN